jgi:hypothetical protein
MKTGISVKHVTDFNTVAIKDSETLENKFYSYVYDPKYFKISSTKKVAYISDAYTTSFAKSINAHPGATFPVGTVITLIQDDTIGLPW